MTTDLMLLCFLLILLGAAGLSNLYASLSTAEAFVFVITTVLFFGFGVGFIWERYSKSARNRRKRLERIRELPGTLITQSKNSVLMGHDLELEIPVYLSDQIRMRHVHILGATGSGKTESVILNFIKQDVGRGLGAIILDAKGDASFLRELRRCVPKEKLRVFDLGSETSLTYNPLEAGSPHEAAQRLFSSLTWSEEYYKSKAFSALQKLFLNHFETTGKNPRLLELSRYLENPESFIAFTSSESYPDKLAERDFMELSGLRDQIETLRSGFLSSILSPSKASDMRLEHAYGGSALYFRLQSLLSAQVVTTLGKLLIQHLNYLAGCAHREESETPRRLIPTYLDEFASFACPEFGDLISKARSAGLALHFSHQSIGDLSDISDGFINRITDSSATKIIMRINDPDSAEFFARSFGTRLYQKTTQRITNTKEIELAEVVGEGTQREARQFRSGPDTFKNLPTGVGSVLIAHGFETPHGASSVFRIKFPKLEKEEK